MAAPSRLIVLDSVMIDVLVKVADLPARGSDSLASDAMLTTGGGFTVASAAHRHGLPSVYGGRLGTGPLSDLARAALSREEVATPVDADLDLTRRDLDDVAVREGDYVYASGYNLVYPEIGDTVAQWLDALDAGVVV